MSYSINLSDNVEKKNEKSKDWIHILTILSRFPSRLLYGTHPALGYNPTISII